MDDGDGEGGGPRLGKKKSDKGVAGSGEVDYKTKAGTAWSHSYLNQKPWHPLSYPNQRRKWIAEQTHANRERRAEEVAREFAQEQEFFRQTALFSKKEKEKVEMMKAVSFMYVRPPGYNAESAKAAEVSDERKLDQNNASQDTTSTALVTDTKPDKNLSGGNKKSRPKDVFGRALPTEEEFEVLKNAPKLETGMPARVKPFGVEIRNVRCVRCGTFGHQSGDRECPLKDVIMPNEESRLKRDDPLTAIMAQTDSSEPLKWELKQKPGLSPPRGGFQPDDPNQQIVAEEIFDEYGGFLSGGDIPALLSNFPTKKPMKHSKRKSRHKHRPSSGTQSDKHHRADHSPSSDSEADRERKRRTKSKHKKKKRYYSESGRSNGNRSSSSSSSSSDSEDDRERKRKAKSAQRRRKRCHSGSSRSDGADREHHGHRSTSSDSEGDRERKRSIRREHKHKERYHSESSRSDRSDREHHGNRSSSSDSETDGEVKRRVKGKQKERENRRFDSPDSDRRRHHRWKRR